MHFTETQNWSADENTDGVFRGVKVLGERSLNKRIYPTNTREGAVSLIEGCRVNLNHVPAKNKRLEPAKIEQRFGKLVNVRNTEEGVVGDLHYIKAHPLANTIQEMAQTMPELLGLSICCEGSSTKQKDGTDLVESISHVFSCDLVADPASTKTLYEQVEPDEEMGSEDHLWQGVKNAVSALLDEDGDTASKLARIKELLKGYEKMAGKKEDGDGEEPQEDTAEAMEQLKGQLATLTEQVKELKQKSLIKPTRSGNVVTTPVERDKKYYTDLLRGAQ